MSTQRRNRMDMWTSSEKAIQDAILEVEKIGADEKLTEAVVLLQNAKELVADFVDELIAKSDPPPPPPVTPGPR